MANEAKSSLMGRDGMDLMFRDVFAKVEDVPILKGISGCVKKGGMLAILGPSGAGKSTLLNTLAGRLPITDGAITLGNIPLNKQHKRKIGYVLQDEKFFPNLTLRTTLMFAAKLRLPGTMKHTDKMKRVDEIVEFLELEKCLDTCKYFGLTHSVIGSPSMPGLSGGEKKRANIACELLSNPRILLLDEPTTGLDSATAARMIRMLDRFAKDFNKTIVATIHQPSSAIFHMFDNVLLVHEGQNAYFGRGCDVLGFFENIDLFCKPHYNPADFMLHKVKESKEVTNRILKAAKVQRSNISWPAHSNKSNDACKVGDTWTENGGVYVVSNGAITASGSGLSNGENKAEEDPKWPVGFWSQYITLCHRHVLLARKKFVSELNVTRTILTAVFVGLVGFQMPRTEDNIRNNDGLMFFGLTFWAFAPGLQTISSFPEERPIVTRERSSGMYRASAFYLAKMTAELPIITIQPAIYAIITYWMIHVQGEFVIFLAEIYTFMLCAVLVQGMALFIGVVFIDINIGLVILYSVLFVTMLSGGFYVDDWLAVNVTKYMSYLYYAYQVMLSLEYKDTPPLICLPPNETAFEECKLISNTSVPLPGSLILQDLNVPDAIWINYIILLAIAVVFRVLGYIAVRYCNAYGTRLSVPCKRRRKQKKQDPDPSMTNADEQESNLRVVTKF